MEGMMSDSCRARRGCRHRIGRPLGAVVLVALLACGAVADPLADAVADVERTVDEYQESLRRLVALYEDQARHATAEAERARDLYRRDLISRRDAERAEGTAIEARARVSETRQRIEEGDRLAAEARALPALAALPPVPPGGERTTPEVVEYRGTAPWTLARLGELNRFFTGRFGQPLPVSALGQTALHDRLGFDHRHAIDVAVHPDTREGRALLDHLRSEGVPFLAFREARPGVSTGAHVHIGLPAGRRG
jgi:hypothetical protein